ncbi:MAG: glutaminyl-peptide cyclotransferase [Bacteroidota bacterium]|nr:glutaminyl-peptide cyclotransferase [Bacteroidota bacterium]
MILNKTLLFIAFGVYTMLSQVSCNNQSLNHKQEKISSEDTKPAIRPTKSSQVLEIIAPEPNQLFKSGDKIHVLLKEKESSIKIDSLKLIFEGQTITYIEIQDYEFWLESSNHTTGTKRLVIEAYSEGKRKSRISRNIVIGSDILPQNYSYHIVQVYPHDQNAYTQGLVYEKGFIYEGTGQRGSSSLRKIQAESGELQASLNLPPDIFGEGICIYGDKIIQLTWTSGVGFVYDKNSFKFLNKINYATQGWGITTDNKSLIMSDGSNALIFLDPNSYTEKNRLEVFDDKGAVHNLNELEFINGIVYANIYTTDKIAMIDPNSGKVLSYIHLDGLLKEEDHHPGLDVLNGIAWDAERDRLFVTGKNWPKLFEIKIVPD